jgi:hypothetical protein
MSDHEETPSKFTLPSWFFSMVGVAGSIVIMAVVLGIAYHTSNPSTEPDAAVVAKRQKVLADVQAAQNQLYYNYSWVDQKNGTVRIPVDQAMQIEGAKLDAETKNEPAAPARMSLAASPNGFVPPPPPVATAAPAATAPAAASAPAATATP